MSNFILSGLFTEGTTDVRFLSSVVERTLEEVALDCTGDIETKVEIVSISKTGLNFNEQVLEVSKLAHEKYGVLILFVHTDSDSVNDDLVFKKGEETVWICRNCGYVYVGDEAPKVCPVCAHPQSYFEELKENY